MACHQAVQNLTAEDGRQRCELFKELPDRKLYPDYYEVCLVPMDCVWCLLIYVVSS